MSAARAESDDMPAAAYPAGERMEAEPAASVHAAPPGSQVTVKTQRPTAAETTPVAADAASSAAAAVDAAPPMTSCPKWLFNLFPQQWKDYLRPCDTEHTLDDIQAELDEREAHGELYNPEKVDIFNAFQCCPPEKVKVVFVLLDPVQDKGHADGLALSAPASVTPGLTIQCMREALRHDRESGFVEKGGLWNMRRWAEQGVLLLNAFLTVPRRGGEPAKSESQSGAHNDLWTRFTDDVISALTRRKREEAKKVAFVVLSSANKGLRDKMKRDEDFFSVVGAYEYKDAPQETDDRFVRSETLDVIDEVFVDADGLINRFQEKVKAARATASAKRQHIFPWYRLFAEVLRDVFRRRFSNKHASGGCDDERFKQWSSPTTWRVGQEWKSLAPAAGVGGEGIRDAQRVTLLRAVLKKLKEQRDEEFERLGRALKRTNREFLLIEGYNHPSHVSRWTAQRCFSLVNAFLEVAGEERIDWNCTDAPARETQLSIKSRREANERAQLEDAARSVV
ncbi:putative uracil-DNA glycosylase [Leptomonas pyrrhocoris]|uniref:Putative uracil-DNA glycosylase n=1 Tax=Leptomonas pyrrhocoris TaxID=157538 RepID=A0A0M9FY68_LEPPY|nr:putative uracil-DNA glycosylase [Leptomonas pyrrhocoris]KPA78515.1 putative uracil-DNA glycosylase [Leptomonas pyrrhocoris]|eukprot:XP_015656954.1 putative uracil-DNA glycosylase [Leptomonas pyrrhocoris]